MVKRSVWMALALFSVVLAGSAQAYTSIVSGIPANDVYGQPDLTTGYDPNVPARYDQFVYPQGLAIDNVRHLLFAVDSGGNRLLVLDQFSHAIISVIGQPNLWTKTPNTACDGSTSGFTNPCGLSWPMDVIYIESTQVLIISDLGNNRLVGVDFSDIQTFPQFFLVLGQPNFTTATADTACGGGSSGSPNACGMNTPASLAFGEREQILFVADAGNDRALVHNLLNATNGQQAVNVLGRPDFTTGGSGQYDRYSTPYDLKSIGGMAYDEDRKRLFVGQGWLRNRIVMYNLSYSIQNGMGQSALLGQISFYAYIDEGPLTINASAVANPQWLAYDKVRQILFSSDYNSYGGLNRVLAWDALSITNGENAFAVIGQQDFTTAFVNAPCAGGTWDGSVNACGMYIPSGIALDNSNGDFYITDSFNKRILAYINEIKVGDVPVFVNRPLGDNPVVQNLDATTTINTAEGFAVTFPTGTLPIVGDSAIQIDIYPNPSEITGAIVVRALLPVGARKTITMPIYNYISYRKICVKDEPDLQISYFFDCPFQNVVYVPSPGASCTGALGGMDPHCRGLDFTQTISTSADGRSITVTGLRHTAIWGIADSDSDSDGVDDTEDLCPDTNLAGPIPTVGLRPNHMGDNQVILGCNASQILTCKPGQSIGEQRYGLSPGIQSIFTEGVDWAATCYRTAVLPPCATDNDMDGDGVEDSLDSSMADSCTASFTGLEDCATGAGDGISDCATN